MNSSTVNVHDALHAIAEDNAILTFTAFKDSADKEGLDKELFFPFGKTIEKQEMQTEEDADESSVTEVECKDATKH